MARQPVEPHRPHAPARALTERKPKPQPQWRPMGATHAQPQPEPQAQDAAQAQPQPRAQWQPTGAAGGTQGAQQEPRPRPWAGCTAGSGVCTPAPHHHGPLRCSAPNAERALGAHLAAGARCSSAVVCRGDTSGLRLSQAELPSLAAACAGLHIRHPHRLACQGRAAADRGRWQHIGSAAAVCGCRGPGLMSGRPQLTANQAGSLVSHPPSCALPAVLRSVVKRGDLRGDFGTPGCCAAQLAGSQGAEYAAPSVHSHSARLPSLAPPAGFFFFATAHEAAAVIERLQGILVPAGRRGAYNTGAVGAGKGVLTLQLLLPRATC